MIIFTGLPHLSNEVFNDFGAKTLFVIVRSYTALSRIIQAMK